MYLEKDDMIVCDNCKSLRRQAWPHFIALYRRDQGILKIGGRPLIDNWDRSATDKSGVRIKEGHIDLCEVCSQGLAKAMLDLIVPNEVPGDGGAMNLMKGEIRCE